MSRRRYMLGLLPRPVHPTGLSSTQDVNPMNEGYDNKKGPQTCYISCNSPMDESLVYWDDQVKTPNDFRVFKGQHGCEGNSYFDMLPFYMPYGYWASCYQYGWNNHNVAGTVALQGDHPTAGDKMEFTIKALRGLAYEPVRTRWGVCQPSKTQGDKSKWLTTWWNGWEDADDDIMTSHNRWDESRWRCDVDMKDAQDFIRVNTSHVMTAGGHDGEPDNCWISPAHALGFVRSTHRTRGSERIATLDFWRRQVHEKMTRKRRNGSCEHLEEAIRDNPLVNLKFKRVGKGRYVWDIDSPEDSACLLLDQLMGGGGGKLASKYDLSKANSLLPVLGDDGAGTLPHQNIADLTRVNLKRWLHGEFKLKTYGWTDSSRIWASKSDTNQLNKILEDCGRYSFNSASELVRILSGESHGQMIPKSWGLLTKTDGHLPARAGDAMNKYKEAMVNENQCKMWRAHLGCGFPRGQRPLGPCVIDYADNFAQPDSMDKRCQFIPSRRSLVFLENKRGTRVLVGYSERPEQQYYENRIRGGMTIDKLKGVPIAIGNVRFRISKTVCIRPYGKVILPSLEARDGLVLAYGIPNVRIVPSRNIMCPDWLYCNSTKTVNHGKNPKRKVHMPVGMLSQRQFANKTQIRMAEFFFKAHSYESLGIPRSIPVMTPAFAELRIPGYAFDEPPKVILVNLLKEVEEAVIRFHRATTYDKSNTVFHKLTQAWWYARSFGHNDVFRRAWPRKRIENFTIKVFWETKGQKLTPEYKGSLT